MWDAKITYKPVSTKVSDVLVYALSISAAVVVIVIAIVLIVRLRKRRGPDRWSEFQVGTWMGLTKKRN